MANLTETEVWEPGIYQLEETDPVQGGPNGIDNQQGKQLANRTSYLKAQVESLGTGKQPLDQTLTALAGLIMAANKLIYATGADTFATADLTAFARTLLDDADASTARATLGAISQAQLDAAIAALVNSSPATLDTLNELAAALGNDANFATTITNALALKAPLASPILTGDPRAPTPAQFDNSMNLATTAFAKGVGFNASNVFGVSAATTLTASHCGGLIYATGSSTFNLNLPLVSAVTASGPGTGIEIFNGCAVAITVSRQGADTLVVNNTAATTITLNPGDTLRSFAYGSSWIIDGGSAQLGFSGAFGSSLAASGYQKLPSGLIIQWGKKAIGSAGALTITFPIAFPNTCAAISGAADGSSSVNVEVFTVSSITSTNFIMETVNISGTPTQQTYGAWWIAIGY